MSERELRIALIAEFERMAQAASKANEDAAWDRVERLRQEWGIAECADHPDMDDVEPRWTCPVCGGLAES